MPAFVPVLVGAGFGLVSGYVVDHIWGDGEYSAGEAAFDAAGGALGGSMVKPVTTIGGRALTVGRAHFSKSVGFSFADDAVGTTAAILSGNVKPIGIGVATSILGDQYTHAQREKSSDVGRASEGTVASGGTSLSGKMITPTTFRDSRGEKRQSCPRGYELKRVGKRMMCVKR
jgi:hypothetical protein